MYSMYTVCDSLHFSTTTTIALLLLLLNCYGLTDLGCQVWSSVQVTSFWIFSVLHQSYSHCSLSLTHCLLTFLLSLHQATKVLTALIFHPFNTIMFRYTHLKLSIHILWGDVRPHRILLFL